jgi:O-antigen/teichoic acid export membrane protein
MNYNRPSVSEAKQTALKSMKWTVLGQIVSRSIQPIITLILARILVPEDFGVIGVALIAIGLANILQDFGLGKTLIQRESDVENSANVIFWTNMTLSSFLYLILFAAAPLISEFFREPRVASVLRVLCLQIVLSGLVTVHQALFQRQFQFKKLFYIGLFSSIVPGLVSVPLAFLGYGAWSLVFGSLAGSIFQVFLFWRASSWRPRLTYDFMLAKSLFVFSLWVTLESLLGWLIVWGDSVIVGRFLGTKELGIYRTGVTLLVLIFGLVLNPLFPVAYSFFSRLQSVPLQFREYFLKTIHLIATIVLPIGASVILLAQPLSSLLLGEKWRGIEIVLIIVGLKDILTSIIGGINAEALRALGRPDVNVKINVVSSIFAIPMYILAASYGLMVFCIARLLVGIFMIALYVYATKVLLKVSLTYPFVSAWRALLSAFVMGIVLYIFGYLLPIQALFRVILAIGFGWATYIAFLRFVDKDASHAYLKLAYMFVGRSEENKSDGA